MHCALSARSPTPLRRGTARCMGLKNPFMSTCNSTRRVGLILIRNHRCFQPSWRLRLILISLERGNSSGPRRFCLIASHRPGRRDGGGIRVVKMRPFPVLIDGLRPIVRVHGRESRVVECAGRSSHCGAGTPVLIGVNDHHLTSSAGSQAVCACCEGRDRGSRVTGLPPAVHVKGRCAGPRNVVNKNVIRRECSGSGDCQCFVRGRARISCIVYLRRCGDGRVTGHSACR